LNASGGFRFGVLLIAGLSGCGDVGNFFGFRLSYILPIGDRVDRIIRQYDLDRGLLIGVEWLQFVPTPPRRTKVPASR